MELNLIVTATIIIALLVLGFIGYTIKKKNNLKPKRHFYQKLTPQQKTWYDTWVDQHQFSFIGGLPGINKNPEAALTEITTASILDKQALKNPEQEITVLHNIKWKNIVIPHLMMKENQIILVEDYILPNNTTYGVGLPDSDGARNILRNNSADIIEGKTVANFVKPLLEKTYGVQVSLISVAHTQSRLNPPHEYDVFLVHPENLVKTIETIFTETPAEKAWGIPLEDFLIPFVIKESS